MELNECHRFDRTVNCGAGFSLADQCIHSIFYFSV